MPFCPDRLAKAQAVLAVVALDVSMSWAGGFWFEWESCGKKRRKRWVASEYGSQFPRWHNQSPFGGTRSAIVTELMRWVKGEPVFPLGCWRFWCSMTIGVDPKALELVTSYGWPERVPCVICGKMIGEGERMDEYAWKEFDVCGPGHVRNPECDVVRQKLRDDYRATKGKKVRG